MERETGFEPATSTLARSHSTAELLPLMGKVYNSLKSENNFCPVEGVAGMKSRLWSCSPGRNCQPRPQPKAKAIAAQIQTTPTES